MLYNCIAYLVVLFMIYENCNDLHSESLYDLYNNKEFLNKGGGLWGLNKLFKMAASITGTTTR